MKRTIFILTIVLISLVSFVKCSYNNDTNPTLYVGVFRKAGSECPNMVTITKSVPEGLPVNTLLNVTFSDSLQPKLLKGGEKITFRIIHYVPDTNTYPAICLMPEYDATVELSY